MKTAVRNTATLPCGCEVAVERGSRTLAAPCEEAERLRSEVATARDALRANERSGSRVGRKPAINEFAAARDEYWAHWQEGVAS
jgi:hypothetical protein